MLFDVPELYYSDLHHTRYGISKEQLYATLRVNMQYRLARNATCILANYPEFYELNARHASTARPTLELVSMWNLHNF